MLKRVVTYSVGAALLGVATFLGTRFLIIDQAPKKVMAAIEKRISSGAGGWNACFHNQTYGPRAAAARRANPDSIISAMAYDLSKGPVRISGETWPRYWSISFYEQNSDNFFVVNDLQLTDSSFNFVLALQEHDTAALDGMRVESPTARGIVLIRRFAADALDMPGILANQEAMFCGRAQLLVGR
ncbi:MAG: DUF1254 domain-containing protein [Pseudomonadota bacterium]